MNKSHSYTLGKTERIKSRKLIEQLFQKGEVLQVAPYRAMYIRVEQPGLQFGVAVGTRHFKRAVQRNRIKRQIREAYRLQKAPLQQLLQEHSKGFLLFIVYTGKDLPEYKVLLEKMKMLLEKLAVTIHENS